MSNRQSSGRPFRLSPLVRVSPLPSLLLVAAFSMTASCNGHDQSFDRALEDAAKLASQGNFEDAANAYADAAEAAKHDDDRVEALYREAQVYREARQDDVAVTKLKALASEAPRSGRAARCWLDIGRIEERRNRPTEASLAYRQVLETGDALGKSAAPALVRLTPGVRSAIWQMLIDEYAGEAPSDLDETLRAEFAVALDQEGQAIKAILAYEGLVERYPLPNGTRADGALLRSAELRRAQGDARGALTTIEILLSHNQQSAILGSYERAAYAEASMLRGFILRDDLDDSAAALHVFSNLPQRHPNSRLVDDALWQAAWTAYARQDLTASCNQAERLRNRRPESRYVPCLGYVCSTFETPDDMPHRCQRALDEIPNALARSITSLD